MHRFGIAIWTYYGKPRIHSSSRSSNWGRTITEAAQSGHPGSTAGKPRSCGILMLLFLAVCVWPSSSRAGWIEDQFPDPAVFKGLKALVVESVALKNMTEVNVSSDQIKDRIHTVLTKRGIATMKSKMPPGKNRITPPAADIGALQVTIRRAEAPVFLGSNINSFSISVKLFQQVVLPLTQQTTWAITWFESRSEIVGTRRPKRILAIVDELIQLFIQDFIAERDAS